MATQDPAPPAPEAGSLTLEQVLEQVSSADSQTFYQQAQRFDQAAGRLHDVKDLLSKYRRDLADAWHSGDKQRVNRLDRLIRHVEGVVAGVQNPGYPRLLRKIGDAIADTKQRLNELKDTKGNAEDDKARADVDKRAAQLLDELSTSYRQLGGELVALPERTDTGRKGTAEPGARIDTGSGEAAPVLVASHTSRPGDVAGTAGAPVKSVGSGMSVKGAGSGTFTTQAGGSVKQTGFGDFSLAQSQPVLEGSAPPPEAAVPFARFAQYAGCSGHGGGLMQGGKTVQGKPVAGLSGRADLFTVPNDSTRPSVLGRTTGHLAGGFTLDTAKQSKENNRHAAAPTPAGSGGMDRHALSDLSVPTRLEAQPAAASAGGMMPVLVSAAGPVGQPSTGGPAGQSATATAAGFSGGGFNQGGSNPGGPNANGLNWGGPNTGGSNSGGLNWGGSNPGGPSSGGLNAAGPNATGPNPGGPNPSGPNAAGPNAGGPNTGGPNTAGPNTAGPNPSGPPASAQTPAPAQVPNPSHVQITGAAGTTGIAPPQPPVQAQAPASIPTQVRPVMPLGAEHLQVPAGVSPGAPGIPGAPLGAFAASSNFAQSSMPPGSLMHSASSALPAGPHGVLGAAPRAEGVWLRADAGSWTSLPVAAARLGRDDTAAGGSTWETERRNEYGKEGR